jgi:outer membrane lipoprotein-sorting protein
VRRALLVTLLAVAPTAAAQRPSADAILTRAARAYQTLSTFQAEFRQRIDDPYIDHDETRGRLYQSGNRFAMRFTDPAGGAIVIDGRHAWVYEPVDIPGQVVRHPVGTDPAYGYNLLGWFLDRPGEKYRASWLREELLEGRKTDVLVLEPLDPTMRFRRATVWFDQELSLPRRFEIDEKILTRTLTLSRIRTNVTLPGNVFTFQVPNGVKVIEH